MESPFCEVIGCGSHAQWHLTSADDDGNEQEQYLCHRHWRQLMADRSHHVIRWARSTASPSSPSPTGAIPNQTDTTSTART